MASYRIREVEWWGPVEARIRVRTWTPWRGLDVDGPAPSPVRVTRVAPTGDVATHVMRTGRFRGCALSAVPMDYLRTYGRRKPMTRGATSDRHAIRILLASISQQSGKR